MVTLSRCWHRLHIKRCTAGVVIWLLCLLTSYYFIGNTERQHKDKTLPGHSSPHTQMHQEGHADWQNFFHIQERHKRKQHPEFNNKIHITPYKTESSHVLFIGSFGRLGNNLFQYASLYGIARATKRKAYITYGNPIPQLFQQTPISLQSHTMPEHISNVDELGTGIFTADLIHNLPQEDVTVCCYLQSWKYFQTYAEEIRQLFRFRSSTMEEAIQTVQTLTTKYLTVIQDIAAGKKRLPPGPELEHSRTHIDLSTSDITYIGVHIRLNDILLPEHIEKGYTRAPFSYIHKAMNHFRVTYPNVMFIICSDELISVRRNLTMGYDTYVSTTSDDIVDLAVLAMCNHTIMSTGTFSWWAAWLAGGQAIYYSGWPKAGSDLETHYKLEDYFLPHWIPMDAS